jgi:hypothetical protein
MEGVRAKSVFRHKHSQKRSQKRRPHIRKKARHSVIRTYPHKRLYAEHETHFYDLFARMSLERDYSIYKRTLRKMESLPRLTDSKHRFDCVIQSLYCVGLMSYERANERSRQLTEVGLTGIEMTVIIDYLKVILNGVVEFYSLNSPPFDMLIRHDIFHNKEATLLGYQRADRTGHMVVLCKNNNRLIIYDKQVDRKFTIEQFLAHETHIVFYTLFKITLHKQDGLPNILGLPQDMWPLP